MDRNLTSSLVPHDLSLTARDFGFARYMGLLARRKKLKQKKFEEEGVIYMSPMVSKI